jgi:membrane protein YdbS with pleckstrin-like domain
MKYIDNNLLPDERIVFRTQKAPVVFFAPLAFLLIAWFFTLNIPIVLQVDSVINHVFNTPILWKIHRIPAFFFLVLAVYSSIMPTIIYVTSDYAVTNKRIIMREGFFDRRVSDTRLSTVSHVDVNQGPIAQLFNYGDIAINSFGGVGDVFTLIARPNEFQKSVRALLNPP